MTRGRCHFEELAPERGPSPWPDPDQREIGAAGIADARAVSRGKRTGLPPKTPDPEETQ